MNSVMSPPRKASKRKKPALVDEPSSEERVRRKITSDPEFAAAWEAILERDRQLVKRREFLQELRASSAGLTYVEKAERWLHFILDGWEFYGELEALVYLASRGKEIKEYVKDVIQVWTNGEQREIRKWAERYGPGPSDIEHRSVYQLADFWNSAYGSHETEATLFRVVEWCGVTGFEPWWRRFANETKENILLGGPTPNLLALFVMDLCRSHYAIELMKNTLKLALEIVSLTTNERRVPWLYSHEKRTSRTQSSWVYDEDLLYAAAFAWSSTRIANDIAPRIIEEAVASLAKHQLPCGAWPHNTDSSEPSIEATAVAIHALSAVSHPRSKEMVADAATWLIATQDAAGYWSEDSCPNPVHLTVLVLDALELATGSDRMTFRSPESKSKKSKNAVPTKGRNPRRSSGRRSNRRFKVALSFPGELRRSAAIVTSRLSRSLGKSRVFYDRNFTSELARTDLDVYLQNVYSKQADLVVIWACPGYSKKTWCGIEWRAIRDIINKRKDAEVIIIKAGKFEIAGIFDHDGYIDKAKYSNKEIGRLILQRVRRMS